MGKYSFLALAVLCSCAVPTANDIAFVVDAESARSASTAFLAENVDCVSWTWRNTSDVSELTRFVTTNVEYTTVDGDRWQTASETWSRRKGDCEDFAILYASMLRFIGYVGDLQLFIGRSPTDNIHAWIEIWPDGYLIGDGHLIDRQVVWPVSATQTSGSFGYSVETEARIP